ncbi:MAG: hypothetical protein MZV63_24345 [Marinilabiliales bacterium]|nr:hypothetical protein [Marinilabiliales bacterium]
MNISGTAADSIHFTADFDRDHRFGEAGERWQNIHFNSNTGSSSVNYSAIEYGTGNAANAGGGLSLMTDNITISKNTSIRKNSLSNGSGGGLYASGMALIYRILK